MHFQPQGCKFNDSYSQNDSIVKFLLFYSRKGYNPYSKNDNSTYEGASDITENALTMGVFVYSKKIAPILKLYQSGHAIWWSEMPMAMYSFFDEYDFSGKTIIPFSSHGGSGVSGTPGEIRRLEPGADVMDGYTVSRGSVAGDSSNLRNWVNSLNLQ